MNLASELGNDLILAVLADKNLDKKLNKKEILPLLEKIREVLEPVSSRDHLYTGTSPNLNRIAKSH